MTATPFAAALKLCGLSHNEAAEYLRVRPDTVKSWSAGRNRVPEGAWDDLRTLWDSMVAAQQEALDLIDEMDPSEITLTQGTARAAEWPSEGTHLAVLALVALETDKPIGDLE